MYSITVERSFSSQLDVIDTDRTTARFEYNYHVTSLTSPPTPIGSARGTVTLHGILIRVGTCDRLTTDTLATIPQDLPAVVAIGLSPFSRGLALFGFQDYFGAL